MTLAEHCNTAPNYIGQIEIGRKFPSVEMIEKIAAALQIEPYLLFKEENTGDDAKEIAEIILRLPVRVKRSIAGRLLAIMSAGIEETLSLGTR